MHTPRWFDIHSPHHRGVGKVQVENGVVTKTSPAYRWALSKHWSELLWNWEREGFHWVERYEPNCKSFDSKKMNTNRAPSDAELYRRISS